MASPSRGGTSEHDQDERLAELVRHVQSSRKYRQVTPILIQAIGASALDAHKNLKKAVKSTKSKLHQIGSAYFRGAAHYDHWLRQLEIASQSESTDTIDQACREIMASHASTRERLGILDTFYATLLGDLPPITSVVDLACGLNPLAIPWMPLAPGASYKALDIYLDLADFLSQAFPLLGVSGSAGTIDLAHQTPTEPSDVALLLKAIPCLEQITPGLGKQLIERIPAQVIIISYPITSLGGRHKGMVDSYTRQFNALDLGKDWTIDRFLFDSELVYRLRRPTSIS